LSATNFALTEEDCYRNMKNAESSVWKAENGKNIGFWVVFQVKKWCDLC